ncbi:MAG: hypoxanthine phosphoribosyltransferase [Clostridiales bacterium]|nr:hypoxanthine phosphoribosyltransferase [Clostridiales bacterium]
MEIKELVSRETIENRLDELAKKLDEDYIDKDLVIVSVLRGAVFFTVELTLRMKSKMQFEFVQVSSYGENTESSGSVQVKKDVSSDISGKDILIVEDIIDSGITMDFLIKHLKAKNPRSIKICSLASKPERRKVDVNIDYLGFEVPNKFLIGYGFDTKEYYRNLPYIGYVE